MPKRIKNKYDRLLCVDLEFSYDKKDDKTELYEIGLVSIDRNGNEQDKFQTYVKPKNICHKTLSFLSLTEDSVKNAPSPSEALCLLNNFVNKQLSLGTIAWCSWGDRDKKIISRQAGNVSIPSGHKLIRSPYYDAQYHFHLNVPRSKLRTSLQEAVEDYCGSYIERQHSALSDARGLSKIVKSFL